MITLHPGNFQCFIDVYREQLIKAHNAHPELYTWPLTELDAVMGRMTRAIERGSFNKESYAFKAACKQLGIKHTYKAIKEFISL